ncbi:unnamed protein product [Brugia timori]|uniref:G_PROTEIN_RECEP_F1_2 domain-containing protein n=1 Tax=Brugia timori TaxID=42155 RepID=A0A0R3QSJ8_9BILA|nr:unnamed protein product [Brugia timori]
MRNLGSGSVAGTRHSFLKVKMSDNHCQVIIRYLNSQNIHQIVYNAEETMETINVSFERRRLAGSLLRATETTQHALILCSESNANDQFFSNYFPSSRDVSSVRLPSNESNYYSRQNHNKTVVSYEYLENKTTEVSNNRTNNNASSEPEEMTASSEIFESYSCITIDLKDSSCFLWRNSGHKLPCQAVSGMTFPVSIVAIDLIYLICTIISVTRSILPLSRKIDFVRCAIHIILWCTASTSTMYLLNTWEHAWKYTNFKAKIPKQFYIAMVKLLPLFWIDMLVEPR